MRGVHAFQSRLLLGAAPGDFPHVSSRILSKTRDFCRHPVCNRARTSRAVSRTAIEQEDQMLKFHGRIVSATLALVCIVGFGTAHAANLTATETINDIAIFVHEQNSG